MRNHVDLADRRALLRYKGVQVERKGNRKVYYFRGDPDPAGKRKRLRLPDTLGSPEFELAWADAQAGNVDRLRARIERRTVDNQSIEWLFEQFKHSSLWNGYKPASRGKYGSMLKAIAKDYGDKPFRKITARHVAELRDAYVARGKTSMGNANVALLKVVWGWASSSEVGLMAFNPLKDVARAEHSTEGHHTWSDEEIEQYRARWPLGARERLALEVLLATGGRRGDACALGPSCLRLGEITFTPEKTDGHEDPVEVTIPVLPELQAALEATTLVGAQTWLVDRKGRPFAMSTFSNWFAGACQEAGLPKHCSAHGLRKAAAARLADNGATESELMAWFGWKDPKMAQLYTRAANKKRQSRNAAAKLLAGRAAVIHSLTPLSAEG